MSYNKPKDRSYSKPLWENEEPIETSPKQYEFIPNFSFQNAKRFLEQWHYSRSANVAAKYCFGLVSKRKGLIGVAVYSKPAMNSIYKLYADDEEQVLELRRLACDDYAIKNTESYFVGKTLRWLILNTDKKTVVTYADPSFGHVGHAYRACNMKYDGVSGSTLVLELPIEKCIHDGRRCVAEGKPFCQVHDRNMRSKLKGSDAYTPAAIKLRQMHKDGIAKLVPRDPKHRYHYHLAELRTGKTQPCRQCEDKKGKSKAVTLVTTKAPEETKARIGLNSIISKDTNLVEENTNSLREKQPVNIANVLSKAWSKDTSYWRDRWSPENPALGQCAVTALIVQDEMGGKILRNEVEGFGSHYFNELPDGTILDLTKRQFPAGAKTTNPLPRERADILKYSAIVPRYELLKERIKNVSA